MGKADAWVWIGPIPAMTGDAPVRHAATIILWRKAVRGVEVLMGQRGQSAVFMPSKFVFPGGAVDDQDANIALGGSFSDLCFSRLCARVGPQAPAPLTLANAAIREMDEETGLKILPSPDPNLRFIFRAITPPRRPRRFDARFFMVSADQVYGDMTGFAGASNELSQLQWIDVTAARALDLPFITEVVLAEVDALVKGQEQQGVPFFDNSTDTPTFRRIV
jgi:8-oxo-dGTP pyrophosphatase MutT (NUDIX family)